MRRFLASAAFPFLACVVLAGATAGAFFLLAPTGEWIGNGEIQRLIPYAGWATGPVIAVFSFAGITILNGVRWIIRLRRVRLLHPVVILAGLAPWLVMGWQLAGEPPYTPIARGVIDFVGRPMLWGSVIAMLFVVVLSAPLLFPAKK